MRQLSDNDVWQRVAQRDINSESKSLLPRFQGSPHCVFADRIEARAVSHERAVQQIATQGQGIFLALVF